jgi:hypothetical protein
MAKHKKVVWRVVSYETIAGKLLTCAKQGKKGIAAKTKNTTRFKIMHKVEDRPHFQGFIWTFPL